MSESAICRASAALGIALLLAAGCGPRAGKIRTARDYSPPPAPAVAQPHYDPFAPRGSADAVWTPKVWDKSGTLVNTAPRGAVSGYRPPLRPSGTF